MRASTRAAILAGFVGGRDATALYFVFPAIRDGLADGDAASASWVLSITSIVAAAVMLQAGRIGDRVGHVRAFTIGAAGYLVGAVASAAARRCGFWWERGPCRRWRWRCRDRHRWR